MTPHIQQAPRLPACLCEQQAAEARQLVIDFEKLDGYGRRVALAMVAGLVRLGTSTPDVAAS